MTILKTLTCVGLFGCPQAALVKRPSLNINAKYDRKNKTLVLVRYRNNRYPGCTTRTSVPFATHRPTKTVLQMQAVLQKAIPRKSELEKQKKMIKKSYHYCPQAFFTCFLFGFAGGIVLTREDFSSC